MNEASMQRAFANNLRQRMKRRNLSQTALAKALGTSQQTVSNWLNAKYIPEAGTLDMLSDYFKCRKSDLLEDEEPTYSFELTQIPVYSGLSCGTGSWVDEQPDDIFTVPSAMVQSNKSYFCNLAEGNSMEPSIRNGDYLIFERANQIDSGKIGSFSLNGEYYCKRFKRYEDGSAWLISDNPEYSPIPIRPEDDFRTLGLYKIKLSQEQ